MRDIITKTALIDFAAILHSAPDLYLVLTPRFEIVAVSEAYLRATMVKREDVLGRYLFDVFPDNPNDPAATGTKNLKASLERVLKHKKPDTMAVQKYDIRRPANQSGGGIERYWSPLNTPVLGKKNEVEYIIHRVEDVTELIKLKNTATEQLKIAEELCLMNEALENKKREQEGVYEKIAELLDANKELESFSYTVSHDLRNSIQVISGFGSLLETSRSLNEEERDCLNEVLKAGKNMRELVEDLLSFSQSTRSEMKGEEIDLSLMVEDILSTFKKQDRKRKLVFSIQPKVTLRGDSHLIRVVLQNLLQNAWKFTAKNENAKIEFGVLDKNEKIYFIRDNGVGFPQEKVAKLFLPFSRLHKAQDFIGSGIGLATVKRIIERHGGRVWAESEAGKGAVFYFSLLKKPA